MSKGVVAIVGRPNVGKSSIFNRLIENRLAITDQQAGITRDRLYGKCSWLDQVFHVIDTGGIELKDLPFQEEIRAQALLAIDEADLILMVVDGRVGISLEDEQVVQILHKSQKPILVAANKIDNLELMSNIYEYYNLGVAEVFAISALHGIGFGDLLDRIVQLLPDKKQNDYPNAITFSIIGQPNVGKSSLTNAILGKERTIVSPIPGATRDAVDSSFVRDQQNFVVIDTAGLRKLGKAYEQAEKYSALRAQRAIERSQIVLVVLDGTKVPEEQDKRIAGLALSAKRAVIIVVNKWDSVKKDGDSMNAMIKQIRNNFLFLSFAPIVFVSALKKQRIHLLFTEILRVYENYQRRVQTNVLNDVLLSAVVINPPAEFNGGVLKIFYATQVETSPPVFVIFVNNPSYLHFSYERYLENKIRMAFAFEGTPLQIFLRKRETI